MLKKKISIVVPSFNEESNISKLHEKIMEHLSPQYQKEIIFIDDGSRDGTLEVIKDLRQKDKDIHYISFSRNFGHQNALRAGIDYASGDCVISMDADLQHPPKMLNDLIQKWEEGYDIVYTKRERDQRLPWLKNISAIFFYKLLNWLSNTEIVEGAADFRLIDRKVADVIKNNREHHLFLRGYISWIGFKQFQIAYFPDKRYSGDTKYSMRKMISFAISGITSFSIKPLRLAILIGVIISCFSALYLFYVLYLALFTDKAITGWASLIASILLLSSINLLCIGILGEYIGKLFIQSKNRPSYIIQEVDQALNSDLNEK
jgi:dolichol-phosphate mannosyltransferase